MADYYPLISHAVGGLSENSREGRRMLYERARSALATQLRNIDPPVDDTIFIGEHLALEEAIREVEVQEEARLRSLRHPVAAPPRVKTGLNTSLQPQLSRPHGSREIATKIEPTSNVRSSYEEMIRPVPNLAAANLARSHVHENARDDLAAGKSALFGVRFLTAKRIFMFPNSFRTLARITLLLLILIGVAFSLRYALTSPKTGIHTLFEMDPWDLLIPLFVYAALIIALACAILSRFRFRS